MNIMSGGAGKRQNGVVYPEKAVLYPGKKRVREKREECSVEIEVVRPNDIEKRSFAIITEELAARGVTIPEDEAPVTKRVIHTTADFDLAETMAYSEGAIAKMRELILAGANIVTDTNMAKAGISRVTLAKYGGEVFCFMADADVAAAAKERGCTRATICMEKGAAMRKETGKPVIFAVGNAPTALIRLREMWDDGSFRPDFIVGVPVGFVNVEVSKELIIETDIPYIINRGRKGGSNIAAAICNGVMYTIHESRDF